MTMTTSRPAPCTQWNCAPPWLGKAGHPCSIESPPGAVPASTRNALRRMLEASIVRGYWRVALRHFLMLQACGETVSQREQARYEQYLLRCPPKDLAKIKRAVDQWVRWLA